MRWRSQGIDVSVSLADVTRAADVDATVAAAVRQFGALSGVVHLAGILDDGLLEGQTAERLDAVFGPKAAGAWHLHRATRELDLEAFVLCSSSGALLGSPGQVTYVAANAFLDALAAYRRSCGLPAVSIGWGNWAEAGRSANDAAQARLEAQGLRGLVTAEALEIFARVVYGPAPCVCVPHMDVARWSETHPSAARSTLWRHETGTPRPVRRRPVIASLRDSIAAVLGAPVRDADCRRPFQSLGLDSLRALELRARRVLGAAAPRRQRDRGGAAIALGHRRLLRCQAGDARQDRIEIRGIPRGRGSLRRGVLRHCSARGAPDGSAAAARPGGRVGGARARGRAG
jgi:hypothetical protein